MALKFRSFALCLAAMPWLGFSAHAQDSGWQIAQNPVSVVQAARAARQHVPEFAKPARTFTNDDLPARSSAGRTSAFALPSSEAANAQFAATQELAAGDSACYNSSAALSLAAQLRAAEDQRAELQRDLSPQQPVISGNNLDLRSYHPGSSGIYVGSAPLQESQPEAPARIDIANRDDQIASLKNSLQLACDPPEVAAVQQKLDAVNASLDWSQRQLVLDQDTFYSNPNYARDTQGRAYLAAQQDYIAALASEKDFLAQELASLQPNPVATEPPSPAPTGSAYLR